VPSFLLGRSLQIGAAVEIVVGVVIFILTGPHPLALKAVPPPSLPEGSYSANALLVKYKASSRAHLKEGNVNDTGDATTDTILKRHKVLGFRRVAKVNQKSTSSAEIFGWYKISLDPNRGVAAKDVGGKMVYPDLEQLATELKKDPNVQAVSKDYDIHTTVVPNDPYYSSSGSWGQSFNDLWGLQKINAASAWDTTTGSSSVVAAVIDTGVDRTHADIANNVWTNPGESGTTQSGDRCWTGTPQSKTTNSCDDDNNGFIDDVYGWNFLNNTNNTLDDNGHGTHVAGTIAGVGNNATGIVGVSWSTKIMPLKFLDSSGNGSLSEGALALQYAADNGAKVTNNSWSCPCSSSIADDAIKYEHDRNVTTVVAAGNNAGNALDNSPANSDYAITVGATDSDDAIASFSNTGSRVDVTAPGVGILSLKSSLASLTCTGGAVVNTNYCHISGTSMATPHVTGLASLLLAVNSSLTPEQIRQILRSTSQDLGTAGRDNTFGYGRIKADSSVAAASSPTVLAPVITSPSSRSTMGGQVSFTGTANGSNFSSYKLEAGAGRSPTSWATLTTSSTPVTAGSLYSFDTRTISDGSYTFRLTATTGSGSSYEYSIFDVTVDNFDDSLATPLNIMAIGTVDVQGVANVKNGSTFDHYIVEWGAGAAPSSYSTTGVTLAGGGLTAVTTSGPLATINTSSFTDQQPYTIRLTVYSSSGTSSSITSTAYTESKLASGWPKYIPHVSCFDETPSSPDCDTPGALFADLDGDGQKEVIIPTNSNKVYAFHKDGSAVSGWPVTVTSGDYFQLEPTAADLDGDLLPEVILAANTTTPGRTRLYVIKSDGTLYPGWPNPIFTWLAGEDPNVSVADLNGDGKPELVAITSVPTLAGAQLHAYHLDGTEITGFPKSLSPTGVRHIIEPPTIADLDGDGHPEIIYAEYNNVFVYNYQGNLQASWTMPNTGGYVNSAQGPPAVGDVDGDGAKEIIINAQQAGSAGVPMQIYAYRANGILLTGWPYAVSSASMSYYYLNTVATADVDNDGKDEVIVGQWGSAIIDDGTGPKSMPDLNARPAPSLADFDGDGNLKVFGNDNSNPVEQWANTSNFGTYWSNTHFDTLVSEFPTAITTPVGDLDKNGHQDFAIPMLHNSDNYVYLLEMPGTTHPKDSWPMFGHDPMRTGHYTVSQQTTDTATPQAVMTSPATGSSQSGTVSITANAIDDVAISKVEFYANSTLISTDNNFPYSASWDTTTIPPGSYVVTAKAFDTSNNTFTSQAVTVTVIDITPPSAPTNIVMTGNTDSSISFSWTASTDNNSVSGYRIYRNGSLLTSQSGTTFTDTSLTPSTSYAYGVEAYDPASNTSGRATADLSTAADSTPPSVPVGLGTNTITDTSQNISWAASTDNVGVTGYQIYRNGTLVGTSATTSFSDTGLSPLTSYSYTVKAFDARSNTSAASSGFASQTLADTTAPATPTSVQATLITMYTQHLSWSASTDDVGVAGYRVYKAGVQIGDTASLAVDSTGLRPGITYQYTVKAYDAAGNVSVDSAALLASTSPDATQPTINFSSVSNGQTVTGTLSLTASATDNDIVNSLILSLDGSQVNSGTASVTYSLNTKNLNNGNHTLKLVATDASGNSKSLQLSMNVLNQEPGDVNTDGTVNVFDLSLLLAHYNQNYGSADFDKNNSVNIFDLSILLSHYGT